MTKALSTSAVLIALSIVVTAGCTADVDPAGLGPGSASGGGGTIGAATGGQSVTGTGNGTGGVVTGPGTSASGGQTPSSGATGGGSTPGGGATGGGGVDAGVSTGGTSGGQGPCTTDALPTTIQNMLTNKCLACHGATPLPGSPALATYANLTAPAKSDPGKTNAAVALARIQSTTMPMPPVGGTPASGAEIAALQSWVAANYPKPACPGGGDAGVPTTDGGARDAGGTGGAPGLDPFSVTPTCTSKTTWTGGNEESPLMNPGMACVSCHRSMGEGPTYSIAGTVYATGHEPDRCNGVNGTTGARVVITGADGVALTLTPNAAGSFFSQAAVKPPYRAKVTYMGRERLMIAAQTIGDCNSCHTQNGATMAPGRIVLP